MINKRHFSLADRLALQADAMLRTLVPSSCQAERPSPARQHPEDSSLTLSLIHI